MNLKEKKQKKKRAATGFALIASISIMVLLVMVALGMLGLSVVEQRSTKNEQPMKIAQANARMALMIAIGELQKAAGPDQRVTATADILTAGSAASDGRAHWTGVWDTSNYDPSDPNTKSFVSWLVSSLDPAMNSTLSSASSSAGGNDEVLIFQGEDAASSVKVAKVAVIGVAQNSEFYAYWVADEGVKADLAWYEGDFTDAQREQVARLTASPGVDYEVFAGPFAGQVEYPIAKNGSNAWHDNLDKALSPADMPLVMGDTTEQKAWLKKIRHDVTFASRGVMADVKNGGLRRDLSLAFEMDGEADVSFTDQPTLFNQQVGEFVGGSDGLQAPQAAIGMRGNAARYLYRIDASSTEEPYATFKSDLQRSGTYPSAVRGPTWWAMRDYYSLYKRLTRSASSYSMKARSYYPNVSAAGNSNYAWAYSLGEMMGQHSGDGPDNPKVGPWDSEYNNGLTLGRKPFRVFDRYIYRPARSNYAPVLLGYMCFLSLTTVEEDGTHYLALGVDPYFYFWNPFNFELTSDKLAVVLENGIPGDVIFEVGGTRYGPAPVVNFFAAMAGELKKDGNATSGAITYLTPALNLGPGEVKLFSASSARTGDATPLNDELVEGTNTSSTSGIILSELPTSTPQKNKKGYSHTWDKVPVRVSGSSIDTVKFLHTYAGTGARRHFRMDLHTPSFGVKAKDLKGNDNINGEQLQSLGNRVDYDQNAPVEYFEPEYSDSVPATIDASLQASSLPGEKNFFAVMTYLAKPADFAGNNANPVEVFSHFNPMPLSVTNELKRKCMLNQLTNSISIDTDDFDVLKDEAGIAFPASSGNGFWGRSLSSGSSAFPYVSLPSSPLLSLVDFSNANLAVLASQPYKAVGNSWANLFVPTSSALGLLNDPNDASATTTSSSYKFPYAALGFDSYGFPGWVRQADLLIC